MVGSAGGRRARLLGVAERMTRARILVGDCIARMAELPDASVDAVVTDPPYHLTSIVDRFGGANAAPAKSDGPTGVYARASRGFMGQTWDGGDVAFRVETWREVLRVLKPGGHLLAFSGSRTYHRMTCAIEDAGFEIRDQIMWVYGSGFPKSLDVSKAIDRAAGAEREVVGGRVYAGGHVQNSSESIGFGGCDPTADLRAITAPATDDARRWSGWGTALKPAHEPICMARKPLVGTVASNVLTHGAGAINVDGCRIDGDDAVAGRVRHGGGIAENATSWSLGDRNAPMPAGRWPANLIHDGSDEATEGLREAARYFYTAKADRADRDEVLGDLPTRTGAQAVEREEGSAGTQSPRAGAGRTASSVVNHHPTVKPTDLMRYLVRMVTPPGGLVLDPFTGSGSTGRAAMLEGMRFVGTELSPEYAELAAGRIRYTLGPLFAHLVEVE